MSGQFVALAAWLGFVAATVGGGCIFGSCACRAHRMMTGAAWGAVTLSTVATFLWLGQPHHAAPFAMIAGGQVPMMPITAIGN